MLRKKTSILWALTEPGIMIQNLETNQFIELNEVQEKIWSYIDGTHTPEEIIQRLKNDFHSLQPDQLKELVNETVNGLIQSEVIIDN